jgi:hypothetical protein
MGSSSSTLSTQDNEEREQEQKRETIKVNEEVKTQSDKISTEIEELKKYCQCQTCKKSWLWQSIFGDTILGPCRCCVGCLKVADASSHPQYDISLKEAREFKAKKEKKNRDF